MIIRTSVSGGPNLAADGGLTAGGQSGQSASQRVTGDAASGAAGQPDGGPALHLTPEVASPQNGGLAKVFAGQPEADRGTRVTGDAASGATGQPDQVGIKPKGNSETKQSNDNLSLPTWAVQLPKKLYEKLTADPNAAAKLAAFKNLDELVEAYFDSSANADGQQLSIPGADSTPEEVQAFYERLGKPKDGAEYAFAKTSPEFARAAFDANLSKSQADAIYKASLAQLDDMRKGIQAALARDYQTTDALLQQEFGDKYDEAVALMQRGMGINAQTGELSPVAQSLINAGLAGKPEIVRAFIEYGRAVSEGTATSGGTAASQPQSVMEGRGFDYKGKY